MWHPASSVGSYMVESSPDLHSYKMFRHSSCTEIVFLVSNFLGLPLVCRQGSSLVGVVRNAREGLVQYCAISMLRQFGCFVEQSSTNYVDRWECG